MNTDQLLHLLTAIAISVGAGVLSVVAWFAREAFHDFKNALTGMAVDVKTIAGTVAHHETEIAVLKARLDSLEEHPIPLDHPSTGRRGR